MKRPSWQHYPADWAANANLARSSMAAQGAWIRLLGVFHDADERGVVRWPLQELAQAAGVPLKLARELAAKNVLKGADANAEAYIYTPRHAGVDGDPVVLVHPGTGPCWYSSRMVRDEWVSQRRGGSTRFTSDNQPSPLPQPKGGIGERVGDGASSSSSSSSTTSNQNQNHIVEIDTPKAPSARRHREAARGILQFVNEKTGRRYHPTDANLRLIEARLGEGFTAAECRQVVAKKCREWINDEKMAGYLRPATLFNATKFSQYAGELGSPGGE